MSKTIDNAIIKTLAYADIFDFPLTEKEISKWLISDVPSSLSIVKKELEKLLKKKIILYSNGYYYLSQKSKKTDRRLLEKYSQEKYRIAQKHSILLSFIPTILLIGVSGTVAAENAKKQDDIDLYIVCKKGSLWTTRFLTVLLTEFKGRRRRPQSIQVKDKICLNMFVDDVSLKVEKKERNLFTAHEVLQMKPIFDKGEIYDKFLIQNKWVRKYLANEFIKKTQNTKLKTQSRLVDPDPALQDKSNIKNFSLLSILIGFFVSYSIEPAVRLFQLWYMRRKRTTEVITDGIIRFHPEDASEWVMKEYVNRTDKLL